MVQAYKLLLVAAVATTASIALTTATVQAHPGDHHEKRSLAEVAQRRLFQVNAHRSLAACANSQQHRALQEQAVAHRQAKVQAIRNQKQQQQQQQRRHLSVDDAANKNHKSNLTDITPNVDPATLFGATPTCILEPTVTMGPFYVTGELIRNDVRESQPGVDLYAELQFIDVNTCEPVPNVYVDFWHANATGVYSGVISNINGDGTDLTNINKTFLRGLAPTDDQGIVQFISKFPGHYNGRATHIHMLSNYNGQVLDNSTYVGSTVSSVGQIFFDQDLITAVGATDAYVSNQVEITLNKDDMVFQESAATTFDPTANYVYLGETVDDGIFAWLSVGIDSSADKSVSAAATWTANGGVANANGGMGGGEGGPGGPGGNGSAPGAPPNGTAPSDAPTPVPSSSSCT